MSSLAASMVSSGWCRWTDEQLTSVFTIPVHAPARAEELRRTPFFLATLHFPLALRHV